jgi:hypothetical protein
MAGSEITAAFGRSSRPNTAETTMTTSVSASTSRQTGKQDQQRAWLDRIRGFWRDFAATAFNSYRPELHYMRGPGPAWHAKHGQHPPGGSR